MSKFLDWMRGSTAKVPEAPSAWGSVTGSVGDFLDLKDPRLAQFLSSGTTESGAAVTVERAMKNTTVIRCVSLVSFAIGMLPLHLRVKATSQKADDHPLFRVLHRRPNAWQTAFEFRALMQQRALVEGNAYARIVRSYDVRSGKWVIKQLVPLDPRRMAIRQTSDWSLEYDYTPSQGGKVTFPASDIFHLRYGMSDDGIGGLSIVKQAAEAIGLALQTEKAAARLFQNGMFVGGVMAVKNKISVEAFNRLKLQMNEREGTDAAGKWIIGEEGLEAKPFSQTGQQAQQIETRKHQIEEIARPFGVPRPLLGVDDTSWGSGIDVLGQFFVRYGLAHWFQAWEEAIGRDLLDDDDGDLYEAKFNAGALLRGSMADQATFFATGLGSGGHQPYLEVDEVRGWLDLPHSDNLPPMPGQVPKEPADADP